MRVRLFFENKKDFLLTEGMIVKLEIIDIRTSFKLEGETVTKVHKAKEIYVMSNVPFPNELRQVDVTEVLFEYEKREWYRLKVEPFPLVDQNGYFVFFAEGR